MLMEGLVYSSNDLLYLRGSMTPEALPGIELTHQVNVVKSAIVELSVWHKRWMLQLISFICGIQEVHARVFYIENFEFRGGWEGWEGEAL